MAFYFANNNINLQRPIFLSGFNYVLILSADFNTTNPQYQNFQENSFTGQRVAACGQTDGRMERQT